MPDPRPATGHTEPFADGAPETDGRAPDAGSARHVVITGAMGGIGSAVREHLEGLGYRTTPIDADETVTELPRGIRADLTDSAQVTSAVKEATGTSGTPWGLVHLAGTNILKPLPELTDADWNLLIAANLSSTFFMNRAVIPLMAEHGGGRVINTSSLFGVRPEANDAAYSAAKAGVIGLSRALALEFAARQVAVNCVAPGATLTERVRRMGETHLNRQLERIPMGRFGTTDDLAHTIAFLLSDGAGFYTGQIFTPNGGDWMA